MSSIIPGYEYDIFISYRQKDNKGDRWVSEFVEALKVELESTFKEEISVYFDVNPHYGLLETHDVDASLKEKLKCLIFIPIISRTYCDPKSFAWEHEFKAFVESASKDQFGLKVKLPNGNVTTRVLPVQIHDLNTEDKVLAEQTLGGYLRPVEFIYKEPGVKRPLTSYDDEKLNLNKTRYRNQINKVANAIDEIIRGLKNNQTAPLKESTRTGEYSEEIVSEEKLIGKEKPVTIKIPKWLSGIALLAFIVIAVILAYPRIFKQDKLAKLRSSDGKIAVAVMPFQNMTNDSTWNVWQDGIQNELINNLTNTEELKVRQIESIAGLIQSKGLTNYSSITPAVASSLSQKLEANVLVYGSIKQAGPTIRVSAQLINSKTEEVFKSFQVEGTADNILHIVDSLSTEVKDFLIISKLEKELTPDFQHYVSTKSPEAYKYFISGTNAFFKRDYSTARDFLLKAIALDSDFVFPAGQIAFTYGNQNNYKEAKKWTLKLYAKRDQMPAIWKNLVNFTYAAYFETPYDEIKYLKQHLEIDDQLAAWHWQIGNAYQELYLYDKAIPEFEKTLEIYNKWGSRPAWVYCYTSLGYAYHKTGQYKKEKELYKKAEHDFPDDPDLIFRQAVLSLTEKDTIAANRYIRNYISIRKENAVPEADITTELAWINSEAGIIDKSEKYFRQALSLDPRNPDRLNNLAWLLIDKDRNIYEGMKLIDKALKLNLDKYHYFDCKGWGFYKQGKYKQALESLEKADSLKPIYNHDTFLHLEAAKKAVAGLK
jgi:TolB-like protein/tetratricopeptide (TPR) repeat protein